MLIYRKELDGLRTLAVLAVIIYHANLQISGIQIFQGGFFGVDVFFVLSGYLITGIIRKQMVQGTFSFLNFYWRRAKRIVPALLVMLVVTSAIAYWILLPNDLVTYAQSLQSALYFGSNYFFYGEDGYTATASIYKPLLHTWSLAVEWQFYIIFPIIVWFINKFFKPYLFGLLFALALLSLQYAHFIVPKYPDMAFYLLPARAWELILGGMITFFNREQLSNLKDGTLENFVYKLLPLLGLFLVMYSMIFIDHKAVHPSFLTLIPVLGTCLFIMFAHKGEVTNDFFSLKPLVFIGLISYPLYLWHQPVFVFFRFLKYDDFRHEQLLLLVFISFVLAFLVYQFIEPIYRKSKISLTKIFGLIAFYGLLIGFSVFIVKTDGYPKRFGELSYLYGNINGTQLNRFDGKRCQDRKFGEHCKLEFDDSKGTVILIGDSNAAAIGLELVENAKINRWNYIQLSSSGCSTLPGVYRNAYKKQLKQGKNPKKSLLIADKRCDFNGDSVPELLAEHSDSTVVYHTHYFRTGGKLNIKIKDELEKISKSVNKLILIYPIPFGVNKIQQSLIKLKSKQEIKMSLTDPKFMQNINAKKHNTYATYDAVKGDNVQRIYPAEYLCADGQCVTHNSTDIYYYDKNHLSIFGAKKVLSDAIPAIFE